MAKRVPLSRRRADESRGIDSIIKPSALPEALSDASSGAPEDEPATASTPPVPDAAGAAWSTLAKVTLYIRPDQVVAIEQIQLAQRQKTGRKPDKSDLVQEALDLLAEKYGLF